VRLLLVSAALLTTLVASGCGAGGVTPATGDRTNGKKLFVAKCGGCHTLADAATTGKVGPNLDDAFGPSKRQGFKQSTIRSVVHEQIAEAVLPMPANLVTGQDAVDVADYVASVAGTPLPSSTVAGGTGAGQTTSTQQTSTQQTSTEQTTQQTTTQASGGGAASGDAAKGKALYSSLGCVGCHSLDGSKGTGPTFKGLYGQTTKLTNGQSVKADMAYVLESILAPDKQIVAGYSPGIMSAVIKPGAVSQADAQALVAYIKTLK
jgi:cytochrome c2